MPSKQMTPKAWILGAVQSLRESPTSYSEASEGDKDGLCSELSNSSS